MPDAPFIFATCQVGAEGALKREFALRWSECHPAFMRPGFVTFKITSEEKHAAPPGEGAIFARALAQTLGKVAGGQRPEMLQKAWELAGDRTYEGLHVWHRDAAEPGHRDYEPGLLPEDKEIAAEVRALRTELSLPGYVHEGATVLDVVIVEPDLWFVGWHQATDAPHTCWPGGFAMIEMPPDAVSRTYLKMEEALRWTQFPLAAGQLCAEIGSAPGGASQALLAHGLVVIGIDPADMHPAVLANPNFRHIKKRGHEVRRREFRKVRWLTCDVNLPPSYTLDTVEAIVMHPEVHVRGLILTLKLPGWDLVDKIPEYLFRVRSWGFQDVRARQLHHNRQEFIVAALRP
jgi:23S rRNA (cytidine2498-2'-O)-methyltransferase